MVVNVKKVFAVFSAVSAVLSQVAYAVNANGESSLSQLEIIDYVVLAGIIILALGMLLVILSAFMRVKNKNEDLYEDDEIVQSISDNGNDSEVYDENIADDEGILDDESGDSDVSDNSEDSEDSEDSEENNVSDSADAADKTDDEADSDDNTDEIPDSAEDCEDNADNAAETNADIAENAEEDEAMPPEPQKVAPKARVSFTWQNNSDVKFVEFSKSATFVDGKVYIEDMNSTNGTFIDGERISRKELKNGYIIILGKMSFKVNISITE